MENPLVRKYLAPVLIVLGIGVFAIAFLLPTGSNQAFPAAIEAVQPAPGDEVLSQSQIGVDLRAGYTAELQLNGVPLPENELRRVEGNNEVFYLPDAGKRFESLLPERNCATARYWLIADGPSGALTYTWCFTAS